MKIAKVISKPFQTALMKLGNQDLSPKSAKIILDNIRTINKATEEYHKNRIEYMKTVAEKDTLGKPKIDKDNNFIFPEDKIQEINKKVSDMISQNINLSKISLDDINDARLSAQEFSLLEELFR